MEFCDASLILARQASFVANQQREGLAAVGEIFEAEGKQKTVIEAVSLGGARPGLDGADVFVHERGFDDPEALLTPAGDGHLLDEERFVPVGWSVGGDERGVERGEGVGVSLQRQTLAARLAGEVWVCGMLVVLAHECLRAGSGQGREKTGKWLRGREKIYFHEV